MKNLEIINYINNMIENTKYIRKKEVILHIKNHSK